MSIKNKTDIVKGEITKVRVNAVVNMAIIIFLFTGCGQAKETTDVENNKPAIVTKENSKDSLAFGNEIPEYILFGRFCGECGSHCATMFRYNMGGNSNTLFVDYTDSYFNKNGKIACATLITDNEKYILAGSVIKKIPAQLLNTSNPQERFGCPDCTDGCGIYFEFGLAGKVKRFSIDTETSELTPEMKSFSEFLQQVIDEMKK